VAEVVVITEEIIEGVVTTTIEAVTITTVEAITITTTVEAITITTTVEAIIIMLLTLTRQKARTKMESTTNNNKVAIETTIIEVGIITTEVGIITTEAVIITPRTRTVNINNVTITKMAITIETKVVIITIEEGIKIMAINKRDITKIEKKQRIIQENTKYFKL